MTTLVELRGVVKEYSTAAGPFPALKGIELRVNAGQFVGVVGRSGSGKTTLVNMIAGLDRPTRGEVYVGGVAVHRLGENDLAVWRGDNVGIVFQFFQLLPNLSILDNVLLPMDFAGRFGVREQRERALQLLAMVEVADHAGKLPSAISGGQQQRVAIARALANDPRLILADEPTGNLDSKTADSIFDLFGKLASEGKTVLLISHDPDLAHRVDRTISVSDGTIVGDSLAAQLSVSGVGRG
jgi:putative ABC transport system ATP-binding protein